MVKKNIKPISDSAQRALSVTTFNSKINKVEIEKLTQYQYSSSTILALTSDWNRFVDFCQSKHVHALPASITAVRMFLERESRIRKFASIKRYSVTITVIHQLHNCPCPTSHRQIHFTLAQLRNMKAGDARQANALTIQHLEQLNSILKKDASVRSIRDLAIYYVMFECALKRSELKKVLLDDLILSEQSYELIIKGHHYKLSIVASKALKNWLDYLNNSSGYIFRRIDKHDNIGSNQLDDSSIYRILRRASDLLGLDHSHRFTGQSARVGATQELKRQGFNIKDIQDFGRWLSPVMPAQYLQMTRMAEQEMSKFKIIKPWD
ncbi:tyrosine-type recombinase/integrase [Vibrio sp. TH_r3]|uniref:tyrosine-type recombinase/integrase n=1 Tax=Vibrio sp. TH_r3 TaxID=3082084 RepID=UPI0029555EBB|nr:tyrosine-type recombinase/integrase [Vibrio sp. TH_r3]MDV7103517.1 tyrosine-type recombinase/integrase [Vibrio sp. TH_r3]